eukprot:1321853-Rhodomonas_salina.1
MRFSPPSFNEANIHHFSFTLRPKGVAVTECNDRSELALVTVQTLEACVEGTRAHACTRSKHMVKPDALVVGSWTL